MGMRRAAGCRLQMRYKVELQRRMLWTTSIDSSKINNYKTFKDKVSLEFILWYRTKTSQYLIKDQGSRTLSRKRKRKDSAGSDDTASIIKDTLILAGNAPSLL